MNVFVTGICGFAGHYLTRELVAAGHTVTGLDQTDRPPPDGVSRLFRADITDHQSVFAAVRSVTPEACIHLAAIASPPLGRRHPEMMLNINILGTHCILEVLREQNPSCRFLLASTAYVYGNSRSDIPLVEDTPLRPNGIYAVSKAAADLMTLAFAQDHGMHAMTARTANHTGLGQSTDFVVPAFTRQLIEIAERRCPPVMHVGNLESERSFLDVRDVARAYRLLIENGQPGQAYNIAAPSRVSMGWILATLAHMAGVSPCIEVDPSLFRPTDKTPLLDTGNIQQDTGWQGVTALHETLGQMLDGARGNPACVTGAVPFNVSLHLGDHPGIA